MLSQPDRLAPLGRTSLLPSARLSTVFKKVLGLSPSLGPYAVEKILHHEDVVANMLAGNFYGQTPVTFSLSLTLECRAHCGSCTFAPVRQLTSDIRGDRHMPLETAKLILKQLKNSGVKAIIFTGGGDPLVYPHLLEVMRYASQLGFEIGLFTNGGVGLKAKSLQHILRQIALLKNLVFIRISLNAADPLTHAHFHGYNQQKGCFFEVIKNIALLANLRRSRDLSFSLGIAILVNRINADKLAPISELIKQLLEKGSLSYVVFRPEVSYSQEVLGAHTLVPLQPQKPGQSQLPPETFRKFFQDFENIIVPGLATTSVQAICVKPRFDRLQKPQQTTTPFCLLNSLHPAIDPFGRISTCDEKSGNPFYTIGDLTTQTLDQIWASQRRLKVLTDLEDWMYKKWCPPTCVMEPYNSEVAYPVFMAEEGTKEEFGYLAEQLRSSTESAHLNPNFF